MIKNSKPISMPEVLSYITGAGTDNSDVKGFIKKFPVLKEKEIGGFEEKLKNLGLIKLREEHVIKIIDFLPEDIEDLNRLFNDINFDEDETKKILEVVKEFK